MTGEAAALGAPAGPAALPGEPAQAVSAAPAARMAQAVAAVGDHRDVRGRFRTRCLLASQQ